MPNPLSHTNAEEDEVWTRGELEEPPTSNKSIRNTHQHANTQHTQGDMNTHSQAQAQAQAQALTGIVWKAKRGHVQG